MPTIPPHLPRPRSRPEAAPPPASSEDAYDRLEHAAERVARRAEDTQNRSDYETQNRLSLLWVHAVVALLAGVQMLLYGTATQFEALFGPQSRLLMGPLALVGGVALVWGLTRKPRRIGSEALGLSLVALWDLAMTLGLAYARIHQDKWAVISPHEDLPLGYVPAYPVTVYAGMFVLLVVHLWTLRVMRRRGVGMGAQSK